MNEDYAHLLPIDLKFDFALLGRAVKAEMARRGLTLRDVQTQARVSRASVSRITTNLQIKMVPVLRLCIWLDVNPFEFVRPMGEVPREKVFHGNTPLKPSENTQENLEAAE
ncbi:helix-turn-helix transcriptional regulator [uncultured Roseibium sp.]|uniref:helix-turn-helix domain-containing protein n=1 Tax=uncultured Roseibium sp. TaxID=1936171 RepID=UPI0026153E51|nr:helix-turn-helix transcriptional regulator [uncultured Roseibium sp.]